MLPSAPKSFGRLSDAYLSAFLALSGKNPLNLPVKQSYAVILVDGLGVHNIKNASAHAGFLNSKLASSQSLFAGFPTTTASSIASFSTGVSNGVHGLIGYRVYDRRISKAINFLNDLGSQLPARKYQDLETISERASKDGVRVLTIGPGEYEGSGFSQATMPAAEYLAGDSSEERLRLAIRELNTPGSLIYLYIPELDQLAHRFGSDSSQWLYKLEELDSELAKFAKVIPKNVGVILTADHGVIDVASSGHIFLDEYECMKNLEMLGGDPRVSFLYFDESVKPDEKRIEIDTELGTLVEVVSVEELVKAGWLSELSQTANQLIPDLVLLPRGNRVCYHRDFSKSKSLQMIGQHGGMTKPEWEVPLLVL